MENFEYPKILIDISAVKSLKEYKIDQNLILGANVSLEDCITIFKKISTVNNDFAYLAEFVKHFELIAHIPVRKVKNISVYIKYSKSVKTAIFNEYWTVLY